MIFFSNLGQNGSILSFILCYHDICKRSTQWPKVPNSPGLSSIQLYDIRRSGTMMSSTYKTNLHDNTIILLKFVLSTYNPMIFRAHLLSTYLYYYFFLVTFVDTLVYR